MTPLKELGISPTTLADIGANCGSFTREAMAAWPGIKAVMIEANDACAPYLFDVGMPYHIACLGSDAREVTFYKRKGGGTDTGNSYYRELTPFFNDASIEPVTVTLQTLPQVVGPDAKFDLIKLDTQSSELDIIRGGLEIVQRAKWVLMEVSIVPYNENAPLWDEVMMFMSEIGFTCHQSVGDICHPLERTLIQRDVLFTNNRPG